MTLSMFLLHVLVLHASGARLDYQTITRHFSVGSSVQQIAQNAPSWSEQAAEFFQCTRQCRWQAQSLDLNIVGRRVAKAGSIFDGLGRYCQCYKQAANKETVVSVSPIIPRFSNKEFDTENTWSGSDIGGYDSPFLCVETKSGSLVTMQQEEFLSNAQHEGAISLHCGKCSACSSRADIEVLAKTRQWITEIMTKISAKFAAPWGHHNSTRLANDLEDAGISFSRVRWDGRADLASCMDVWLDNIMCDAMTCKQHCWVKFFDASNDKTEITDPHWWQLNAKCLKCDEVNCGPAFIMGAGANRRSTGIDSDISRPEWQKCKHGLYSGVPLEELPTNPKPQI